MLPVPAEPETAEMVPGRSHQSGVASVTLRSWICFPAKDRLLLRQGRRGRVCERLPAVVSGLNQVEVGEEEVDEGLLEGLSVSWWSRPQGAGNSLARQLLLEDVREQEGKSNVVWFLWKGGKILAVTLG